MKKKKPPRRRKYIDTAPLKGAMERLGNVVGRARKEGSALDPDEHLPSLREATFELRAAVEGFKRAIKQRMLADGFTKPRRNKPYLKLRRGRPAGSKDPDDYDVVANYLP